MHYEYAIMLSTLAQAVACRPFSLPDDIDWKRFVALCKAHAVAPLVYNGFHRAGLLDQLPEDVYAFLRREYCQAIYKDIHFDALKQRLSGKMCSANIPHIFLKGACLKYDYPESSLRTMCDLDILVHAEDFDALGKIAESLGGTAGHSDGNHRNYHFPSGVEVEFHPNLLHQDTPVGVGINPGWQYAARKKETGEWTLSEEGFYLNTICHLANHFVAGGVGVRFVLDVWVCRNLRKAQPNRAFVEAELQRFGLLEFARNIERLAESWFGDGEMTDLLEELGEYILTSGLHGNSERAMLNAVSISPGGNRCSALLKKVFYSREEMEGRFSWIKGKPWLLPVAWFARALRAVTNHGNLILRWMKGTGAVSREEIIFQRKKLLRFGIALNGTKKV